MVAYAPLHLNQQLAVNEPLCWLRAWWPRQFWASSKRLDRARVELTTAGRDRRTPSRQNQQVMAANTDDMDTVDDETVYTADGGTRIHTRSDCPSLSDATLIREHRADQAPDWPLCGVCGPEIPPTQSAGPATITCPYCSSQIPGARSLRVHVRDEHPDKVPDETHSDD